MGITVYIPTPYRELTGQRARVECQASDLAGLLEDLEARFPGIKARVMDERGELHRYVGVFINDVEAEALGGPRAALRDGDEVALIPAIAGGGRAGEETSMAVEVRVPPLVQRFTRGARVVQGTGDTLGALLDDLERQYPGLREQLVTAGGELHRFVNIYLNDEDVRFLQQLGTALKPGDVVTVLPAMAGGSARAAGR
jgi:molybdopterin converting factor small subunit